jgi:hypothetical protein
MKRIEDVLRNYRNVKALDRQIKELGKTVANIIETSPVGDVFKEGNNLTDHRKQPLGSCESQLRGAGQTAEQLLKRVQALPGGFLAKITPGTQTKKGLSSDLKDVVENIRCGRMRAVYPEIYANFKSDETSTSSPLTPQPSSLEQARGYIQSCEEVLGHLEKQNSTLEDFVKSRDPGKTRTVEDRYFASLTEEMSEAIESLKGHISGLKEIGSKLQKVTPRDMAAGTIAQEPDPLAAQSLRSSRSSESVYSEASGEPHLAVGSASRNSANERMVRLLEELRHVLPSPENKGSRISR